jgi:O-acetylhomoserine (thiol)-lyase
MTPLLSGGPCLADGRSPVTEAPIVAAAVAEHLADHPDVGRVNHPGLDTRETHDTASEHLDGGYGGMITSGLDAGYEAASGTVNNVELASLLTNVGDAKTPVIHPTSTTHQQSIEKEQAAAGVTTDMIRFSVGPGTVSDIIADPDHAIDAAT